MGLDILSGVGINISKKLWQHLNETRTKQEIKDLIINTIINNKLPLPYQPINSSTAIKDFQKLLYLETSEIFKKGDTFTRFEYDDTAEIYIGDSRQGCSASNYFHQASRYKCDSVRSPSPLRVWNSRKFLDTTLNALWSLKYDKVTNSELHRCIAMRKYIATQFRPSVAKAVIDYFEAETVLDFSAGWGDRLCGFFASNARTYVGVDPNINLFDGYKKQMIFYSKIHKRKNAKIINAGAEETTYEPNTFDLIFTSPPYFNVERYTGNVLPNGERDQTQSWVKYPKFNDWLENFLIKAMSNAWEGLKPNGHMAINISDCYSGTEVNRIVKPMIEAVKGFKNSEYQGQIGMKIGNRPNSGALKGKSGVCVEPIFIWKKLA